MKGLHLCKTHPNKKSERELQNRMKKKGKENQKRPQFLVCVNTPEFQLYNRQHIIISEKGIHSRAYLTSIPHRVNRSIFRVF